MCRAVICGDYTMCFEREGEKRGSFVEKLLVCVWGVLILSVFLVLLLKSRRLGGAFVRWRPMDER